MVAGSGQAGNVWRDREIPPSIPHTRQACFSRSTLIQRVKSGNVYIAYTMFTTFLYIDVCINVGNCARAADPPVNSVAV